MKVLYFIVILSVLITVTACTGPRVVCNEPYIRVGTGCCLDYNDNSICDDDESMISDSKTIGSAIDVLKNESDDSQETKLEENSTDETGIDEEYTEADLSKLKISRAYWDTMFPEVDQEIELTIEFENIGQSDIAEFEYIIKIYEGSKVVQEDKYEYNDVIVSGAEVRVKDIEYSFDEEGDYSAKIFITDYEDNEESVAFYVAAAQEEEEEESDGEEIFECTESDNGRDETEMGYCEDSRGKFWDECGRDNLLYERYCHALTGECQIDYVTCNCEEGRCI